MAIEPIPIVDWTPPAPTTTPLDYADLTVIDLSQFHTPGGKEKLVEIIKYALTDVGFWMVTNTGFTDEEIRHQFALGQTFYEQSLEERNKNRAQLEKGGYFGYRGAWEREIVGSGGVKDNMELVNVPKYTENYAHLPRHELFKQNEAVIADFSRRCWQNIACPLYVLFALAMELPENYFVERHEYEKPSEDHLRYMMYHPRTKEEDAKCQNLWSWAHTDYGSLTILFSQTVSGLQVKMPNGAYKDIKPMVGSAVVNVADTLSFMTKGYLKSTIHRVTRPPPDQDHIHRVGVIYGCRPNDNVVVCPAPSPVLLRQGLITQAEFDAGGEPLQGEEGVTALEYLQSRVKAVHAQSTYGAAAGAKFKHKNLEIIENHADTAAA